MKAKQLPSGGGRVVYANTFVAIILACFLPMLNIEIADL
jgi:hypothetical protein